MSPSRNGARPKGGQASAGEPATAGAERREEPVFRVSRLHEQDAPELDQAAADSAQAASDNDQTASGNDQTASDNDQTASDIDQAQSDFDQDSSDSDQAASDRDQLASDNEAGGGADRRVRRQASIDRSRNTRARDRKSSNRASAAEARERNAEQRDRAALERDRAALVRDAAAEMLDEVTRYGDEIELELERKRAADRARATNDRAKAAEDRRRAAADRMKASADREEAVRERTKARRERAKAALALETSETDELTRVRRRGAGVQQLQREMDRARRVAERLVVAFIDVDGLKAVNDAGGHAAGDALLVAVADALRACLRSYDLIVRVGGDEFICVLPKTELSTVRERFVEVSAALACGPTGGSITVGLAELTKDDVPGDLIARADADLLAQRQRI